jgi:hypothetical protein
MTGMFLRVKRDGARVNVEIDRMTDDELDELADRAGGRGGWMWAKALAQWIRDNVNEQALNREPSEN